MSVQGEKSFIGGWGAVLQLPLVSLVSMGGGTMGGWCRGNGELGGGLGVVSVQG